MNRKKLEWAKERWKWNKYGGIHCLEMWHWWFGHVGYSGLQKLLEKRLVDGFNMDEQTHKPDCIMCTEAKQHIEPFPNTVNQSMEPRELTHIDLWGKYTVNSINSNQYYLLFMDNTKHYITVSFLKEKSEVAQAVINYIAQLLVQGWKPRGIQIAEQLQRTWYTYLLDGPLLTFTEWNCRAYELNTCRTCMCDAHCKWYSVIPLGICGLICSLHTESIIHKTPADFNTLSGVV